MKYKIQIFGLIIFSCCSLSSASVETITMRENANYSEIITFNNNLGEFETKNLIRCANKCVATYNCLSLFYKSTDYQCILHNFRIVAIDDWHSRKFVNSPNWKYYEQLNVDSESPSNDTDNSSTDTDNSSHATERPGSKTENPNDDTDNSSTDTDNSSHATERPSSKTESPNYDTDNSSTDTDDSSHDTDGPSTDTNSSNDNQCSIYAGFFYNQILNVCISVRPAVKVDFEEINKLCAMMNSELIRITSQAKQDWVANILAPNSTSTSVVCIQGNNDNDIGEFRFDDDTPMSYFNWNSGQAGGGTGHYIVMRKNYNYQWHDFPATHTSNCTYICEK